MSWVGDLIPRMVSDCDFAKKKFKSEVVVKNIQYLYVRGAKLIKVISMSFFFPPITIAAGIRSY